MKTKTLTLRVTVPEDYDLGPVTHRIGETLEAVRGNISEEPPVPDDVRCTYMTFTFEVTP